MQKVLYIWVFILDPFLTGTLLSAVLEAFTLLIQSLVVVGGDESPSTAVYSVIGTSTLGPTK